jgi:hypothetical protein
MEVVRAHLEAFDAVCMATALHVLASRGCSTPAQCAALFERADALRLMRHIRAQHAPVPCFESFCTC